MTIPTEILQFASRLESFQAEALLHCNALTTMADTAEGPQEVGYAALASELEQVGKVLGNYMPRILKHVGAITTPDDEVPVELTDLARESEPFGETRDRLWSVFIGIQHKLADDGKTMPKASSEEVLLYTRLYPHLGWLAKPGAVEILTV